MTGILTIAHISDLHLGPISGFTPHHWDIKRGLGYLNWLRGRRLVHRRSVADALVADIRAQSPDHIAVSGDLANLGLPGEYAGALRWLEELGAPARVSVVPGNHDIYTILRTGATCFEVWAPYMQSDAWGAAIVEDEDAVFPFVRRLGFAALVGINSSIPTPPFVASGKLGDRQIERLDRVLERLSQERLMKIVMIHHPPFEGQAPRRRALRDANALTRVLEKHGADVVIHGHNHLDMEAWLPREGPHVPALGVASGSAARSHKNEPLARYNLLQLKKTTDTTSIEIVSRGLVSEMGPIAELSRRPLLQKAKTVTA